MTESKFLEQDRDIKNVPYGNEKELVQKKDVHVGFDVNGAGDDAESTAPSAAEEVKPRELPPVHQRKDFKWMVLFGVLLTLSAGLLNGISYNAVRRTVMHASGGTVKLGIRAGDGDGIAFGNGGLLLLSFAVGSTFSGFAIGNEKFVLGHRYGVVLMFIGSLFLAGTFLLRHGINIDPETASASDFRWAGSALWALGAGMQNGMYTGFSGAVIRTTHVTGTLTDIGLVVGHVIRTAVFGPQKDAPATWKLRVLVPLYVSFFFGGMLSKWAHDGMGIDAAFIPSGLLIFCGIVYYICHTLGYFDGFLQDEMVEEEIKSLEHKFSVALHNAVEQAQAQGSGPVVSKLSSAGRQLSVPSRQISLVRQISIGADRQISVQLDTNVGLLALRSPRTPQRNM